MDYRYSTYPDGVYLDPEYTKKFDRIYTSTNSPLIPNSIMKEVLNDAWDRCKDGTTVGEAIKESERRRTIFEGGLDMKEFEFDVWDRHFVEREIKKIAVASTYGDDLHEFHARAEYVSKLFDAEVEVRMDLTGMCKERLTTYLTFTRRFNETDEQFNNRLYLAERAIKTPLFETRSIPRGSTVRCPIASYWASSFDIYQGVNHKTEKLQTIVKWDDGETTTVSCNKYDLPLVYPVAYAYCKRYFGNNSRFKKKVHTRRIGDYIYASLHVNGDHFTASVPARSKKIDIYDEMALVFASSRFGSIMLFEDMCRGNFHKGKEDK